MFLTVQEVQGVVWLVHPVPQVQAGAYQDHVQGVGEG